MTCSTPDWHALTPVMQPVPLPTAATQAGSCCTPQHHPSTARAETPDTAKLLQRALASSSGSALLNSLSEQPSHPMRSGPAGLAGLNEGGTVATTASSAVIQQSLSGSAPVLRSEQQHGGAGSAAISSSSTGTALVSTGLPSAVPNDPKSAADGSASAAAASALLQGSQADSDVASRLLINQEAVSRQQVWEPIASHQSPQASASHRQQLSGPEWQQQQQIGLSSVQTGQQCGAGKQAKHTGQPRRGLETEEQAAAYEQPSEGLKQVAEHHGGPLQHERAGPTDAQLAAYPGHVTSQVQLELAYSRVMFQQLRIMKAAGQAVLDMSCSCKSDFTPSDSPIIQDAQQQIVNSKLTMG